MKVSIDFSIFSVDGDAIGLVTGGLEFRMLPQIGASIELMWPRKEASRQVSPRDLKQLRIENIIFTPAVDADEGWVVLMLEALIVPSRAQAREIGAFLDEGFGLMFDEYEQNE